MDVCVENNNAVYKVKDYVLTFQITLFFKCHSIILEFQRCVLKKLVELMEEMRRIRGADPLASGNQVLDQLTTLEDLDAAEERAQMKEEKQALVK